MHNAAYRLSDMNVVSHLIRINTVNLIEFQHYDQTLPRYEQDFSQERFFNERNVAPREYPRRRVEYHDDPRDFVDNSCFQDGTSQCMLFHVHT